MADDTPTTDELDRSIVERLRVDGRETNRSLAAALGVNEATIAARLRRLEAGHVVHVVALMDMYRAGFPYFAFAMITTSDRPVAAVAQEIAAVGQTIFVNLHTGRYDIIAGVLARDREELGRVFGEVLPKIRGVRTVRCELAVDVLRLDSAWAALGAGDQGALPGPEVPAEAVDELDLRIIGALQGDARSSNRGIAADLGVSEGTVRSRLRRMEDDGLIRIRAVSNIAAFGHGAAATVGVHVADGRIDQVAKGLQEIDSVAAIIRSLGEFDFLLILLAESRPLLLDVVLNRIQALKGIRSTETFETAGTLKHLYTWVRLVG
jgi:DNA-binding Lrp family transcriptional regulator